MMLARERGVGWRGRSSGRRHEAAGSSKVFCKCVVADPHASLGDHSTDAFIEGEYALVDRQNLSRSLCS